MGDDRSSTMCTSKIGGIILMLNVLSLQHLWRFFSKKKRRGRTSSKSLTKEEGNIMDKVGFVALMILVQSNF